MERRGSLIPELGMWGCWITLLVVASTLWADAAPLPVPATTTTSTDRWALIIDTSRFWFNYRHNSNALSLYHILKDRRYPDDRIILMLGENYACDPRNRFKGTIYNNMAKQTNLYRCDTKVDFTGYEVTVRNTLEILEGLFDPYSSPGSRRMNSGPNSNVLWYMTGHGATGFLKFLDTDMLSDEDIGRAVSIMHHKGRYGKLLIILETCHAQSLCLHITAPNVVCVGSSLTEEDSYSHHHDPALGVHVIDRFTYETLEFFKRIPAKRKYDISLWEWLTSYDSKKLYSHVYWNANQTLLQDWKLHEFFEVPMEAVSEREKTAADAEYSLGSLFPKEPELH